jgi:dTDP-4-amino-4,6-dideoxygalactose transaminase
MNREREKLAIDGGPKAVEKLGPYPSKIGKDELWELIDMWDFSPAGKARIKEILDSEVNLAGPHLFRYYNPKPSRVAAAEEAMRELIGVKHCLGVNSCTSALLASYKALGIGAGDEVIVPAYTFFATAATVVAANAIPVIVDVDDSLNLDAEAAERAITPRTKAIAVVHMRGAPAAMDALADLAKRQGLPLVEDAAQSGGGSFGGKRLGSIGTLGCFSFDYYKVIVSGEGGFVTTDDEWLYTRAQSWHDTAACWRPDRFARERREGELFAGENYRMSELEGAVALAQIRKADEMLAGYRRAKSLLKAEIERLPGLGFRRLPDAQGDTAICLIMFLPDPEVTRKAIAALHAEGVPAGGVYDSKVRDWHIFTYWEHVLEKKSVAPDGLPWSSRLAAELPRYTRDMCPRALDLLGRSVHVEINYHYSAEDCRAIASGINKVFRHLLG